MARIMAIDFGAKRTGIAVTDPLQIIATALSTVATKELFSYLSNYFKTEEVELVLIGYPTSLNGDPTHATPLVKAFAKEFAKKFPQHNYKFIDEQYSSKKAVQAMIAMGTTKKQRAEKENIDKIAATILLQEYLYNKY